MTRTSLRSGLARLALGSAITGLAAWLVPGAWAQTAQPAQTTSADFERQQGFITVVVNHVNDVLSTENLPVADGGGVEAGVFVTATMDEVQIFDRPAAGLQQGRVADPTIAAECISGCPAVLYDAFQRAWLEAAIESTTFTVDIPARVVLAVHHDLPAQTLLQIAYAAAETRPVQPPQLALLVNNTRGTLRAKPFFLVPPGGLDLRQGSAALGLTIEVTPQGYRVSAADSRYARDDRVDSPTVLASLVKQVKKRYPGKETVILVPKDGVTAGDLMKVVAAVQDSFPRIVLSGGQKIRI